MNKKREPYEEQMVRIAFPERYWVVLLGLLDEFITKKVKPEMESLRKKGVTLEDVDETQSAILAGPIMIRGQIIKELSARGVVKPEANWKVGIDALLAKAESSKKQMPDKKKPK